MDIDVFSKNELEVVFRALRTALAPEGTLQVAERRFLQTYALITGFPPTAADPLPLHPAEVHICGAHECKRLVQLAGIAVLLGRPVKAASVAFLKGLSQQLATHDPVVDVADALLNGRHLKARMLTGRRSFRVMIKEAHAAQGVAGVLRFFGALFLRIAVDRDKHAKYRRLGLLPEGTLGRAYWKHMTETGFGFPGETGGIPDLIAYHDIAHVLTGYDTSPLGEIQRGSFQGGNRREDGFFFIQFALLQFHQGIQVTPAAAPQVGHFDPERVLWAVHRGAQCGVDMTHQWDFWPLMRLPLAEARARCGMLPPIARFNLRMAA